MRILVAKAALKLVELGFEPMCAILLQSLVSLRFSILPLQVAMGDSTISTLKFLEGWAQPWRLFFVKVDSIKGGYLYQKRDSGKSGEDPVEFQQWNIDYKLGVFQQGIDYMTYGIIFMLENSAVMEI